MSDSETAPRPPRQHAHWLWRCARSTLLGYGLLCAAMMWMEPSLVFAPVREPLDSWQPPALPVEEVWFESADGTQLYGWYLPHDNPRAVVLIAGGNSGNVSYWAGLLERLHDDQRLAVMAFDYRGYGQSEGSPSEQGILADARAARDWLAQRAGIEPREIVLWGRSMGGGVAVDLAAADGCRGLILQSTFTSMYETASGHYPYLPVRTLMRTRLDSLAKIGRYAGPVLQSHGDADEVIPLALGQKLHAAIVGPKEFFLIPGGMHNDPEPHEYMTVLDQFIDRLP